jgi:hypothetical protein
VLLRYLIEFSSQREEMLFKIIDRLFKDKTQIISHIECTALSLTLFRKYACLNQNGILHLSRPLFVGSKFIATKEVGLTQVSITKTYLC